MDAVLVVGFYLAVALILQATVSEPLGAYAALGLVLMVVLLAIALQLGAPSGGDDSGPA